MNGVLSTAAIMVISLIIAALDITIFGGIHYSSVTLILTLLACIPYFVSRGDRRAFSKEIWVICLSTAFSAAMIVLSSASEFIRPCTASVVSVGIFFGPIIGFTCGFFSVLIASLINGMGGWTVFQLLTMGFIGFMSGLFRRRLIRGNIAIIVYALIFSIIFSSTTVMAPIWDSSDGFDFSSYTPILVHAFKWFQLYAVSDIIITLILKNTLFRKAVRLKKRFRIFEYGYRR
ncbi:MAG: ECF transporter S component [Clostridium sp.]|nr:ECF transporter S component [Clostridium sp.]MCM1547320.1 ECF transporter S component [Ruminococcus sp.]